MKTTHAMHRSVCLAAMLAMFSAGPVAAADIAAGKDKAAKVCAACHGPDGNKTLTPDYPRLAGQPADYLRKALGDYKAGLRKDPVMGAQAKQLSDEDVANVAAWFASQQGLALKY